MKIELDQTVWVNPIGNNARRHTTNDPIEATVSKIGRKYFEVTATGRDMAWKFYRRKFHLDSGIEASDFAGYKVYETKQEIEEEALYAHLSFAIRKHFSGYGKNGTLAQLVAIAEILEIETLEPIDL